VNSPILDEIPESAATGEIATIYADVRTALGVPLVNLVFRNMAAVPGCLPWAWACLKPIYSGQTIHRVGAEMCALAGTVNLAASPIDLGLPKGAIAATLESYIRANPINLLGLDILKRGLKGSSGEEGAGTPAAVAPITDLLPMADIKRLPDVTVTRLRAMAHLLHGEDGPVIPSVFRHFATSSRALDTISQVMTDLKAGHQLDALGRRMAEHGRAAVSRLVVTPPSPPTAATAATIERLAKIFPENMTKMTVVAVALRTVFA
jgi:hypothetical protein